MPYLDIILTFILLSICAYTDIKKRKIYNLWTIPLIPIGLFNTLLLYGFSEGLRECLWLIPTFIICLILFKIKQIGAGDAKLILATGSLLGMNYGLSVLGISFVCGWVYIIIKLIKNHEGNIKEKREITIPLGLMMFLSFIIVGSFQLYLY